MLVGDNIDITVNARYLRTEKHHNQSLHFFHSYAVRDRIDMGSLSLDLPATCNPSPVRIALALLPSKDDDTSLLSNIAILISRVLITYMPFFAFAFSDAVTWHICHRFYKEMSSTSEPSGQNSKHITTSNETCNNPQLLVPEARVTHGPSALEAHCAHSLHPNAIILHVADSAHSTIT